MNVVILQIRRIIADKIIFKTHIPTRKFGFTWIPFPGDNLHVLGDVIKWHDYKVNPIALLLL
jgi:hypothetical protein